MAHNAFLMDFLRKTASGNTATTAVEEPVPTKKKLTGKASSLNTKPATADEILTQIISEKPSKKVVIEELRKYVDLV